MRSGLVVSVFIALQFVGGARGQWLELSRLPEPPRLGGDSYGAMLAASLTEEIDPLSAEHHPAMRASASVRRLARFLLQSDAEQGRASERVVIGMELYTRRSAIDDWTQRLQRSPDGLALLREFSESVESIVVSDSAPSLSNSQLIATISPLLEALGSDVSPNGQSRSVPDLEELRNRAALVEDGETEAVILEITEFLKRGWAFAALRPQIVRWHAMIDQALDYSIALSDAIWLEDAARREGLLRARDALNVFRDPAGRAEGERRLRALHVEGQLLEAITNLSQNQEHQIDVSTLRNALLRIHDRWNAAEEHERLLDRIGWLKTIVARMNTFRDLGLPPPTPRMDRATALDERRRIRALIVRSYLEAEKALLEKIEVLAPDPRLSADPAHASLVGNHRQLHENFSYLERLDRLTDVITLIRPASQSTFEEQARRLALMLVDPVRRVDAAMTIEALEHDFSRYWPLPFENALRSRSEGARTLVGDLDLELTEAMDRLRDAWALELGDGVFEGEASKRLALLHRLLAAMKDIEPIVSSDHEGDDHWWMPGNLAAHVAQAVLPRLHRGTEIFLEGDDRRMLRALDRIEHEGAAARLFGRLVHEMDGPPLKGATALDTSDGTSDTLAALFIHYAAEASHARTMGRDRRARVLLDYINRLALIALTGE